MTTPVRRSRSEHPAARRVLTLSLIALLTAVSLLTLASLDASAEGQDQDDEPLTQIQLTDVVVTPTPDAPLDPAAEDLAPLVPIDDEPVDDPVLGDPLFDPELLPDDVIVNPDPEDPEPAPSSVTVHKWACPAGIDAAADNALLFFETCTDPMDGVAFTLSAGGSSFPQVTAGGTVTWTDLDLGPATIAETLPPGYAEPVVYCTWTAFHNGVVYDAIVPIRYAAAGGTIAIEITVPNTTFVCHWYNVPETDDTDAGIVTVYKYACPEGIDTTSDDWNDYFWICTTPMDGVTFHLLADGLDIAQQTANNGHAWWGSVGLGAAVLAEETPAGYGDPVVFCGLSPFNDPAVETTRLNAAGGSVELDVAVADGSYVCYWFNIPHNDASITIVKHTCPAGYDFEAAGADPMTDCPDLTDGVTFTLSHAGNPDLAGATGDAGPGRVSYDDLEPGDYTATETIPTGVVALYVECRGSVPSDNPLLGPALSFFKPAVVAGAIELSLGANETIVCDWFNVPEERDDDSDRDDDPGKLVVLQLPNTGTGAALGTSDRLADDSNPCPDGQVIMPGTNKCVPEDILNPAPVPADARDDDSDTVSFAVVDTDLVESDDEDNGFTEADIPAAIDDAIEASPEEPEPETVTVSVRKMECLVPVHAISDDIGALGQLCVDPMGGVQFHLLQGGLNKPNWTNANGFVTWHDVALDVYSIVEKVPAGYGEPIVFCRVDVGNSPWVQYNVLGGGNERRINMELDTPGADFLCSWYNVQPDNPGSITINKRLCPAEYDYLAAGADPELDCPDAMDGVAFTLQQPIGPDITSHTGDTFPGAVRFDGLLSGEYAVSETLPAGIAVGFVTGCVWGGQLIIQAYNTTSSEPFKLEVNPGQEIVCNWYNIPGEKDDPEGSLTVFKYWCAGAFTTAAACALATEETWFLLSPVMIGSAEIEFATGPGGSWQTVLPAPSVWSLTEKAGFWCHVESNDFDANGHILISEDHESVVHVFNCADEPDRDDPDGGRKDIPVWKLPNTGTGSFNPPASTSGNLVLLVASLLAVSLMLTGERFTMALVPK